MTDTPFKAGETYRTRDDHRFWIATTMAPTDCPIVGVSLSNGELRSWRADGVCVGAWDDRYDLLPPTPPAADDLAAARAEIERLREASQRAIDHLASGPTNDWSETAQRILRAALAKEKPDAAQ